MMSLKYLFFIFAITACVYAVKVDMQGSISLGRDVLDALGHFLRRRSGGGLSGRRFMNPHTDSIAMEVISSALCRKIDFCTGVLYQFVNEYVISLAKVTDNVFEEIHNIKAEEKLQAAAPIFGKLKGCLREVRKIIKLTNLKEKDLDKDYIWVSIIKKISAKFQTRAITYLEKKLNTSNTDIETSDDGIKKNVTQKLVIGIAEVEALFQKKLCQSHKICLRSVECTKSLQDVLERLIVLSDSRVKSFMKSLYELLPDTNFYSQLSPVTANEFQDIINDMAFTDYVHTKDILLTVQKILATRLNTIFKKEENVTLSHDLTLVNIVMSDMDFFFSRMEPEPFRVFFEGFKDWTRTGGQVNTFLGNAITNIQEVLNGVPDELIKKLTYEVRVFLELTVDPEHEA